MRRRAGYCEASNWRLNARRRGTFQRIPESWATALSYPSPSVTRRPRPRIGRERAEHNRGIGNQRLDLFAYAGLRADLGQRFGAFAGELTPISGGAARASARAEGFRVERTRPCPNRQDVMCTEIATMRRPRSYRKPAGRMRWLLGRLVKFCANHGWWPSAAELTRYVDRGSRWTTRRDLAILRHGELVCNLGRRWALTLEGFSFLGIRPIVPRLSRKPTPKTRKQRNAEARRRRDLLIRDAFTVFELRAIRREYAQLVEPPRLHSEKPRSSLERLSTVG